MRIVTFLMSFAVLGWSQTNGLQEIEPIPGYGTVLYTDAKGNLNEYLDKVLEGAKENFDKFNIDPMHIPNFQHTVEHKVWFVKLRGGVSISNGIARGLKSLHRAGDATLHMDEGTNVMKVDGSLGVRDIDINANVYAWYSFIKANLKITGKASYMSASVELELPLGGEGFQPKATSLRVNQISGFKLKITGLGILNWLAEKIVGWYVGDLTNFINKNFAHLALDAVNSKIGSIVSPNLFP